MNYVARFLLVIRFSGELLNAGAVTMNGQERNLTFNDSRENDFTTELFA